MTGQQVDGIAHSAAVGRELHAVAHPVSHLKTVLGRLGHEDDALPTQCPTGGNRVCADRRPAGPGRGLDLQPPGYRDRVVVDDGNGHDLFMEHRLPQTVQAGPRADVHAGHVEQVQRLGAPAGQRAVQDLPSTVGLIVVNAVGERGRIVEVRVRDGDRVGVGQLVAQRSRHPDYQLDAGE